MAPPADTAAALGALVDALARPSTWRLALRNVARQKRRSAVVLAAVSIGLGGLVLAMALNFGMVFQMAETVIRTELGDLQVHAAAWDESAPLDARLPLADTLLALRGGALRGAAPRLRGEALVFSPRASVGVRVVGVHPVLEREVSTLASLLVDGAWWDGAPRRVLIGEGLARRLQAKRGDKLVLSVQDVRGELTGEAFRVGGVLRAPSRELDEAVVWARLEDAQPLYGVGEEVSEVALAAPPGADLDALKADLAARLGAGARVETWRELEPLLVAIIEMFDQIGWIVYAAIFVAMAFGIANVLLMSVFERTREIGVLLAIGMPPARMVAIVLAEALVLVVTGVALGFALGLGAVWLLRGGIDLSLWAEGLRAFGIPTRLVPVARSGDVWAPSIVAVVTALAASFWPALRVVRTRPAEAVRRA
jgi:ABC-type lipoprotein release transport system permease subunit